ncbi:MAG TPA: PAS domain-containing sensor histidine kinase [Pseudorhodoplanes sp.]|nr:PAS domain-containing sensor histidine kinase [Pseudorhodoplanes sp.]HWV51212.1 PAS domain-containing sensor histidine kinase [Pseudorhodoplanes sp.]
MSILSFAQPLRDYIDSLVHPSVQQDPLTATRHRAFIAPRLLGSLIALAIFPVYLAMRGVPSALEIAVFAWLVVPILTAVYLSRTGRYEGAHILSSLSLTGLVFAVAYNTGGISSFAAIWLVVVPLEASLSASRRVVLAASAFALAAAGALLAMQELGAIPAWAAANHAGLAALGIISAALYATGLALGAESLARMSFWLFHAEEDRYRLLARNMTDVITRHGQNGAVLFVSPAAQTLFGARVADLMAHGLFDRVHVADRPAYLSALADAAQGEQRSVEFRVKRIGSDGENSVEFIWVEMRCRPLDQTGAQPAREVVAVMRDVSDRKAQEQALELARAESERANAAKTRFLATMSHELRTPLNAIIGFSEMLVNEDQMRIDAKKRREYAQLINDSGTHLLAVVNGILDMSKMETGDFIITPEPFAPVKVISNCCDILALRAREAGLDLVMRNADDLPDVVADKRAFKQIMLNLLSNAIKFTGRGGNIIISSFRDGDRLVVSVEDNGVGISAADLPSIGNPFFQARSAYDRRHDGTGLGLSIVKGLVTLHGGDMQVRSELGKGTKISIHLPLDCEANALSRKKSGSLTPFEPARKHNDIQVRKSA